MTFRPALYAVCALSVLSACAQVPSTQPTVGTLPEAWRAAIPPAPATDATAWWTAFADPTLDALVREAMTESVSVQTAALRIRQSRAQARATIAGFAPSLSLTGNAQAVSEADDAGNQVVVQPGTGEGGAAAGTDFLDAYGVGSGGLGASWEVPLFGRLNASLVGARALEDAAQADLEAARVALVGDIADAYVSLRAAQVQQQIQEETLARLERIARIAEQRGAAGLVSRTDVANARSRAEDARRGVPDARLAVASALNQLAILRGKAPGVDDARFAEVTALRFDAPPVPSAPAELLRRRPDLRSAEAQAVQAAAAVGVARSELYPRVSLQGALTASTSLFGPDFSSNRLGSAQAAISLPLFDYGQRRAGVSQREAEFEIALLAYRQAALQALGEGQEALAAYAEGRDRLAAAEAGEKAAQETALGNERAYEAGLISMRERLDTETSFAQARLATLAAQRQLAAASVALYRAFAGSPPL